VILLSSDVVAMSISSDPILQGESDYQRLEFITGGVATCSTFSTLSTIKFEAGDRASGERSLGHAEVAYEVLLLLVLNPGRSRHLTNEQVQGFTVELQGLRERLDRLQQFRKWPTELNGKPVSLRRN
jgi:hypothetical protein